MNSESKNGEVDGEWIQEKDLLFSKKTGDGFDGGHGMIFSDRDGKKYLCLHSPNGATKEQGERTVFLPIKEENGSLVCDV
ncbi:MAG: hypothetical protein IKR46_02395 [Clostridia bacterium]|nr:hypothetical protein [Clostridia bacterium]